MINRRNAMLLGLSAVPAAWQLSSPARAQQAFQQYFPFLVDLDGWQGKKPDGLSMEMPGNTMITATREYERGPSRIHVQILYGPAAKGVLAMARTGMNIETSEGRMHSTAINGMPASQTFNFKDKSGAIIIALGDSGAFSFAFNGIPEDEALALAKKFDWKAMQAAQPK